MNFLERAICAINPAWAYERAAWREALRSYYDAGGNDRLNAGWTAVNASAEQTDRGARDFVRARNRDLERNSDIYEGIIGPFERNVVGTGIRVQAKVTKANGEEDESLNQQIEELFKEWRKPRNCDVTGQQSFEDMQRMAVRRLKVDGGIFFIKTYNGKGPVPFTLQAREVDELDTSITTLPSGALSSRIVDGIEFDEYNCPIAYHFKKFTPDGYWAGKSERIPAQRVIFLWRKDRPTQIREMSPLAKTITRVRDINEFQTAVSMKERILACFAVFIKKYIPTGGGIGRGAIDQKSGYPMKTISPGMIKELHPGDSIEVASPSGQSTSAREFISTQQRLAGAGQGLSYEAVSRDMSQVNYSSARQGLLEDQQTYMMWQQFLIEKFCEEVYTEFVISAVLSGKLQIKDFWANKSRYLKHEWYPVGWSWIDPLKEATANMKALDSNQDTLARICAARGLDWRDVLKQRAKEVQLAQELGINITQKGGSNNVGSKKESS